jgi:hypothetical protein
MELWREPSYDKKLINGKFECQEKIDRMKKFIVNEYLSVLSPAVERSRNADSPLMLKYSAGDNPNRQLLLSRYLNKIKTEVHKRIQSSKLFRTR